VAKYCGLYFIREDKMDYILVNIVTKCTKKGDIVKVAKCCGLYYIRENKMDYIVNSYKMI
jgi:hypothetical protein